MEKLERQLEKQLGEEERAWRRVYYENNVFLKKSVLISYNAFTVEKKISHCRSPKAQLPF